MVSEDDGVYLKFVRTRGLFIHLKDGLIMIFNAPSACGGVIHLFRNPRPRASQMSILNHQN
jgi:hypothetical protein